MKRLLVLLFLFAFTVGCKAQDVDAVLEKDHTIDTNKVVMPADYYSKVNQVITQIYSRYHYRKPTYNDSLSALIFNEYIGDMDHNKLYFYKSDLEDFAKYKTQLDDYLLVGKTEPAYYIFNIFKKRLGERVAYIHDRLGKEFDFTKDEYFVPNRKDSDWAASKDELDEIWRKRLKNEALNLKLAGKDWEGIVKTLENRYDNFYKRILQYDTEDVFQLYMNAYSEILDPHSNYFSPINSDNFKISMSLSLEGIGAQLSQKDDYTVVHSIIPGGPAFKDGRLKAEDKIVGVAQGEDGEMVDVIGWKINDVIQLIRGKKGTVVRLNVLSKDDGINALPHEIKIVRDKVKLEEQSAKSDVISIDENNVNFKLGVITIPSFYIDYEAKQKGEPNYKSTTRDVRKILSDFKKENIDGVIIDLRNNGGGSLEEAIKLSGLFIKEGPVVQVKNTNNVIEVDKDPDPNIIYSGPLAVMINRYSASASEIFSAAIQDYDRGVLVGEQTYGKGTVQNMVDLNRFIPINDKRLGQIKLTIAKFYRISGGSTQDKGVIPDITFPSDYDPSKYGESSRPSALPWDQIKSAGYQKYNDVSKYLPKLKEEHKKRIANNLEFQFMMEDVKEVEIERAKKKYSLNEEVRKNEMALEDAKKKRREEERQNEANLEVADKQEVKQKNLRIDDPQLEESGHILADLILASVG